MTTERAILYGRVSTDEQAEQGNGLSYQRSRCTEYAERRGYAVVQEITDQCATWPRASRSGTRSSTAACFEACVREAHQPPHTQPD